MIAAVSPPPVNEIDAYSGNGVPNSKWSDEKVTNSDSPCAGWAKTQHAFM